MKRIKLFTTCSLLAFAVNVLATDELRIADFIIAPGETKTISVELENPDVSYIMLDFLLQLPDGVTIDKDEDGELIAVQNDERFTRTHELAVVEKESNIYHVLIFSSRNAAIKGNSGELFSITVTADAYAIEGTFQGRIFEQVLSDLELQEYNPVDRFFNVEIKKNGIHGDVNNDGSITIADVTALVNIFLGKDNAEPYQYNHNAADVDGKDGITEEDVTALVNMILNQ